MSETVTDLSRRCPRCGRQLPPDAPEGLCASCLLTAGAETLTGSSDATSTGGASTGDPSRPGAPRLVDGQLWGPYRVIRLLGRGGMGEVYEAEQLETGRRLALKVLRDTLRGDEDRARFLREGQLAASISHAHTVYIFGSEEVGGAPAITMELLSGGTLKDRVSAEGPMPPSAAVSAVLDIIGGLDAAQAAGILHRDIKPSNCFVDADGAVKVGDFGLSISTLTRDVRHELATAGFEGTPQFAAPEQLRGEPLDVRADIYAVGATLYYLLTGRPPLDAPDFRELVSKVASEKPPSPRVLRRDIPRGLAAVVLRCLAKAPAGRPQSYAELADLLRPYGSADEVPAPLGARFIAWIADSAIVSIMIWLLMSSAWTVGVTLESAATAAPTLGVVVARAGDLLLRPGRRLGRLAGQAAHGLARDVRRPIGKQCRWWLRVGLRTAVFHVPSIIFFMGATRGSTSGRRVHGAVAAVDHSAVLDRPPWQRLDRRPRAAEPYACRAAERQARRIRRSEGVTCRSRSCPFVFATRRTVRRAHDGRRDRRRTIAHRDRSDPSPSCLDSRSCARNTAGRATRRDVSRPGRLYWLAGRRSATENWDAFEAPRGEPFLTAPPTSDWRQVHRALSSLAIELDASAREASSTKTGTHGSVSPTCGGERTDNSCSSISRGPRRSRRTPIRLSVLSSCWRRSPLAPLLPIAEPAAPLSATTLLHRLASGAPPALADIKAELLRLASIPSRPSRVRRALPMVMAAMPVAVLLLIVTVMLPMVARSLRGESSAIGSTQTFMRWMTWITDSGADAEFKTQEQRTAAEQYVAAHFGPQLTSDGFWAPNASDSNRFSV